MTGDELLYPWVRWLVLDALAQLADEDYQRSDWLGEASANSDFVIHTLYDDYLILPDPEKSVGMCLQDGPELARLRQLDQVLGPIIDELGGEPDEVYLKHKDWPAVLRRASLALAVMVRESDYTLWRQPLD